ncbi:MAG: glycosyl transferase, partial [Candidatus Atribacteria bacterium]|nr:glycosyl transferase [Candidatus Atribacteria bacterium]
MNKIYKKTKENIKNNNFLFIVLIAIRAYGIYFLNKICNYKQEKIRFYKEVGYQLNLKNPKSFHEKIVWKKINDRNPLLPITADKYKVRSYIKEVLGEEKAKEILIPLLYVTDQSETIPFERLPSA